MMGNRKGFWYGALAGSIIGSVAALMLAPKSGRELRKDIADGSRQVGDRTVKIAGQVGDTTTRIAKQVGSGVTTIAAKTKDTAESMVGSVRSWRVGRVDGASAFQAEAGTEEELAGERAEEPKAAKSEELQTVR
ncbi:YtxH domain-containing protein [Paenibacillus humicola]|uniref:YtxH domain-containing protein n=1 Tax=Paenibacillus humicola TaxID=3110540 RepID=UPI00237A8458|nr:YtxH domain-containing protein [Paenibacillus humicola]